MRVVRKLNTKWKRKRKDLTYLGEITYCGGSEPCEERGWSFVRDDEACARDEIHPSQRRIYLDARLDHIDRCIFPACMNIFIQRQYTQHRVNLILIGRGGEE